MSVLTENFLNALGESIVGNNTFNDMRLGSGTGTIAESLTIGGLFAEEYSELFSTAGNSITATRTLNVIDVEFSILLGTSEGNGAGFINYLESGVFDSSANKISHWLFNHVIRKDSSGTLTFRYVLSLTKL